jgi:hypothetical protein
MGLIIGIIIAILVLGVLFKLLKLAIILALVVGGLMLVQQKFGGKRLK